MVIRLRRLRDDDVTVVDSTLNDPDQAGEFQWFGYGPDRLSQRFAHGDPITEHDGYLAVETTRDGTLAGMASWHTRDNARPPNGRCWAIGMLILPDHRGLGIGTAAHRVIVRYLFQHTPAVRIEADTEVGNVTERRALERAGFVHEGTLRQAVFRAGRWRDSTVYSVVRSDLDDDAIGADGTTP